MATPPATVSAGDARARLRGAYRADTERCEALTGLDLDQPRRGRMLVGTLLFVLGFTAVFVSYGALFGGLGALLARPVLALLGATGGVLEQGALSVELGGVRLNRIGTPGSVLGEMGLLLGTPASAERTSWL